MVRACWRQVREAARCCWRQVGRRGAFLVFLGLLDLTIFYSLVSPDPLVSRTPTYLVISSYLPLWAWAVLWLAAGAASLVQAAMRTDRIAFAASAALFLTWGILYGTAWLRYHLPRGWLGVAIWIAFAAIIMIISAWPETYGFDELREAYDESQDAIVTIDDTGIVRSWNKAAAQMFGWNAAQIVGSPMAEVLGAARLPEHLQQLGRDAQDGHTGAAGRPVHLTGVHRTGAPVPLTLTLMAWRREGLLWFTGVLRPYTAPPVGDAAEDGERDGEAP